MCSRWRLDAGRVDRAVRPDLLILFGARMRDPMIDTRAAIC